VACSEDVSSEDIMVISDPSMMLEMEWIGVRTAIGSWKRGSATRAAR
jgi:hypothetical protein